MLIIQGCLPTLQKNNGKSMLRKRKYATYYGEYSLKNWIRMILNEEITLPEYQRYFVWSPEESIKLVDSLIKGVFVPPVVISSYSGDDNIKPANYILDGQQRLSSVLLVYLGYWPVKFIRESNEMATEDSVDDSGNEIEAQEEIQEGDIAFKLRIPQNWDFKDIQEKYKICSSVDELKESLDGDNKYKKISEEISGDKNLKDIFELYNSQFLTDKKLKESFLGYSFINGIRTTSIEEKKLFSDIFRRINISGKPLTSAESRAAFYWLNPERKEFLSPQFTSRIRISNKEIDWARALAFTAEAARIYFDKNEYIPNNLRIAVGFGYKYNTFENYIERYVKSVVDDVSDPLFKKFDQAYLGRLRLFESDYTNVVAEKKFSSIVDADYYIWGLLFWTVFQGERIKRNEIRMLRERLDEAIFPAKAPDEISSANRLGRIRRRMKISIEIYQDFLVQHD